MLYLVAAGAVTPLGLDAERTVASLRSGLDRFREIPFAGLNGDDLKASRIDGFLEGVGGIERYAALAVQAIEPCLVGLTPEQRACTAVLIGLPRDDRPGVPEGLLDTLRKRVADWLGLPLQAVHGLQQGRASVHQLLAQADRLLTSDRLSACVVGGVDTLVNANSLRGLTANGAIKEEWDGFIPSEAAAFVRVQAHAPDAGVWGGNAAAVMGIGLTREPARGTADAPLVGVGLSAAYRMAMETSGLRERAVDLLVNDVNGSRAAFEDMSFANVRFFRSPRASLETWHIASYLGEIGAAAGALELIWAGAALELGFAPGRVVMLSTSEADVRTAVVMQGPASTFGANGERLRVSTAEPVLHSEQLARAPASDTGLRFESDGLHTELARENLGELSWLFETREKHHQGRAPWVDIEDFERRLLAHLDAMVWSGETAHGLARTGMLADEESDVSGAALVLLSRVPDASTADLLYTALTVPGPQRSGVLAVLPHVPRAAAACVFAHCGISDDITLRAALLRAATMAGWINENEMAAQWRCSPESIAGELILAAASAGLSNWSTPLCAMVQANPTVAITGVNRVALLALAPPGAAHQWLAPDTLARDMPVALALLCLRDGLDFSSRLADSGTLGSNGNGMSPALLEAFGWSGEQHAVPLLLDALQVGSPAAKLAAANALYRILGIACMEDVPAMPDDPTDTKPSTRLDKRLSQSAEQWAAAVGTFRSASPGSGKLRHGLPWSNSSALRHLRRRDCAHGERRVAAWEYAVVQRAALPLQPASFVGRQKRAIEAWSSATVP